MPLCLRTVRFRGIEREVVELTAYAADSKSATYKGARRHFGRHPMTRGHTHRPADLADVVTAGAGRRGRGPECPSRRQDGVDAEAGASAACGSRTTRLLRLAPAPECSSHSNRSPHSKTRWLCCSTRVASGPTTPSPSRPRKEESRRGSRSGFWLSRNEPWLLGQVLSPDRSSSSRCPLQVLASAMTPFEPARRSQTDRRCDHSDGSCITKCWLCQRKSHWNACCVCQA